MGQVSARLARNGHWRVLLTGEPDPVDSGIESQGSHRPRRKLLATRETTVRDVCGQRLFSLAVCMMISSASPAAAQSLFDTEPAYGQRLFPLEQPRKPRLPVEDVQDDPKWKVSRPGMYSLDKTNLEIRTEPNDFSVFERGKRIYSSASLPLAKRFAEQRADNFAAQSAKARREQQQQPLAPRPK